MAVERHYRFDTDFVRNPISGSAAWFFVIILKFIFKLIFEIKLHEKIRDTKSRTKLIRFDQILFQWRKWSKNV